MRHVAIVLSALMLTGFIRADEGRDIVERAMKARSDNTDLLDKQKCQAVVMVGKIVHGNNLESDATFELKSAWPWQQHWQHELDLPTGKSRSTMGFNIDRAWTQRLTLPAEDMDLSGIDEFRTEIYGRWLATLYPLKDKAFTFAMLKDGRVGDEDVSVVRVTLRLRPDIIMSFSKKTGHLLKVAYRASEGGAEVRKEHHFSDYRDFDGLKLPTRLVDYKQPVNAPPAKAAEWKISSYKFLDKLPADTFEKPEKK